MWGGEVFDKKSEVWTVSKQKRKNLWMLIKTFRGPLQLNLLPEFKLSYAKYNLYKSFDLLTIQKGTFSNGVLICGPRHEPTLGYLHLPWQERNKVTFLATAAFVCSLLHFQGVCTIKGKWGPVFTPSIHELRLYSFIHLTILASLVFSCAGLPAIFRRIFSRVLLCALTAISPGFKEWKSFLTCRDKLWVCRDVRIL